MLRASCLWILLIPLEPCALHNGGFVCAASPSIARETHARPQAPDPTSGWTTATPESQMMSTQGLEAAVNWLGSLESPDAFIVIRGGYIVSEMYWGETHKDTLHDLESGAKSIGAMALAHALNVGHFDFDTNLTEYFPTLTGNNPDAASVPLQLKHLVSMAGGANVTYWAPGTGLTKAWTEGLRQGPPGEVESCTQHGLAKRPGSNFLYSFANPAIAEGLLAKTTNMSYAQYLDTHLFPKLGIQRSEWRWLGDHEGNSQPDGGSFHTARNYAKLAYLMLRGGRWTVNGTRAQLLSEEWVQGAAKPTPLELGPCPIYSHFFWRKDLNFGNEGSHRVPADTFYAYGGGGQFAVVVPSLDLVVVSLYGGKPAVFTPPVDVELYKNRQYFPTPTDHLITDSFCDGGFHGWGCWNFSSGSGSNRSSSGSASGLGWGSGSTPGKIIPGMPSCDCTAQDTAPNDLLAGMMQRVVAAITD